MWGQMAKKGRDSKAEVRRLRIVLLNLEDEVSRLVSLCHLGGLAADGMHGIARTNDDATALSFYFMALREDLEKVKRMCQEGRG